MTPQAAVSAAVAVAVAGSADPVSVPAEATAAAGAPATTSTTPASISPGPSFTASVTRPASVSPATSASGSSIPPATKATGLSQQASISGAKNAMGVKGAEAVQAGATPGTKAGAAPDAKPEEAPPHTRIPKGTLCPKAGWDLSLPPGPYVTTWKPSSHLFSRLKPQDPQSVRAGCCLFCRNPTEDDCGGTMVFACGHVFGVNCLAEFRDGRIMHECPACYASMTHACGHHMVPVRVSRRAYGCPPKKLVACMKKLLNHGCAMCHQCLGLRDKIRDLIDPETRYLERSSLPTNHRVLGEMNKDDFKMLWNDIYILKEQKGKTGLPFFGQMMLLRDSWAASIKKNLPKPKPTVRPVKVAPAVPEQASQPEELAAKIAAGVNQAPNAASVVVSA